MNKDTFFSKSGNSPGKSISDVNDATIIRGLAATPSSDPIIGDPLSDQFHGKDPHQLLGNCILDQGDRHFLSHFVATRRSWVHRRFLDVIRAVPTGSLTAQDVVNRVDTAFEELAESGSQAEQIKATEALAVLRDHLAEALAFGEYNIQWESLSRDEKDRLQAPKRAFHQREWMLNQPASEAQKRYIIDLGHRGPVKSMWHAHELIEQLKRRRH